MPNIGTTISKEDVKNLPATPHEIALLVKRVNRRGRVQHFPPEPSK